MLQTRSHIEYLIQTYHNSVLILYSKLTENLASLTVFNTIWWCLTFLGPPSTWCRRSRIGSECQRDRWSYASHL